MAKLKEIMTTEVLQAAAETTVSEVATTMVKRKVGSVIVMEGGWISGIFTERDALRAAASGRDLTQSPLKEWMTSDPITAEPDMDSEEAIQVMASHGFRHLPVTDGKDLAGIVSLRDVLSARVPRPS
jgi:CBS domain-containing protein